MLSGSCLSFISRVGAPPLAGRAPCQRSSVVARLKQNDALIPLPVSYYEVLQVTKDSSSDDCRAAFDELMASPMVSSGYSTDCVYSRAQLLKVAADCLVDTDARAHYNNLLATGDAIAQVLPEDLPGALALLQETQHPDLVIKLAKIWLEESADMVGTPDVALAMAQSYCDLANEALSGTHGRVTEGYEYLTKAADVLGKHNCGAQLAEEIAAALSDFTPAYVAERLKAPIGPAREPARALALQKLKEMLWAGARGPYAPGSPEREHLLASLRPFLAAAEVLELYDQTARATPLPVGEQYDLALAGLAEGLRTCNPRLVETAADQFAGLEHVTEVEVERAVCALLLGYPDEALEVLNLRRGSLKAPSLEVLQFVDDHSEGDDDQLPAVVLLAERWMMDVLVPEFPEFPAGYVPSLNRWGEDEQVQAYLETQQHEGGVLGALQAAWARCVALFRRLAAALTLVAGRLLDAVSAARGGADALASADSPLSEDDLRHMEAEERRMWAVGAAGPLDSWFVKCAAAAVPVCALLAFVLASRASSARSALPADAYHVPPAQPAPVAAVPLAPAAAEAVATASAQHADMAAIKTTLYAWQEVKQQAMGPHHNVAALESVLDGNMLQSWTTRANHVKRINWHWQYNIENMQVSVAEAIRPDVVKVEVTIREKADAIFKGEVHDSYRNEYAVEYQLTCREGNWKISGSRITRDPVKLHETSR